jgi:ribose transport system substrate-binding protein
MLGAVRLRTGVLATVLVAALIVGCNDEGSAASKSTTGNEASKGPVIGVSLLTFENPFFTDMRMAMKGAAYDSGYKVDVVAGEFDTQRQQQQIADFVKRKVDAIVVCPVDSKAIGPALTAANQAGIPVFTADVAVLAEGVDVVSHVATDNLQGGRLAADAMVEALGGKGKVAVLNHPEVESAILRERGFQERLQELKASQGVTIDVVASVPGQGQTERSRTATEELLRLHPEVDGVFAINDPSAMGAIAALEQAGKLENVTVVGFDGQAEALESLVSGKMYADVLQLPKQIGRLVVQTVDDHRMGREVPPERLIQPTLIRTPTFDEAPVTASQAASS